MAPIGVDMAPHVVPKWCHEPGTVRREPQPPARGRRRPGTSRPVPSTRTTRLPGRPALHGLGTLANPQGEPQMPTFDTPEPISVTVEFGVGDLRIVASDRTDTMVEVRPSDPT